MARLDLAPNQGIYYKHHRPAEDSALTYVFFNALTGDATSWEASIAPVVREAGHGTLTWNYRGQTDSPFTSETKLTADLMAGDAVKLLAHVMPVNPVLVGLSIGGLFASRAYLAGADARAMVFINTLREDGPRLQWIGDALVRAVEVGGLDLFRDLFLPLLVNQDWQAAQRENFLEPGRSYKPLDPASGVYKLLSEAGRTADWDLAYEELALPVLSITGLEDHVFLEREVVNRLFARLPRGKRLDMPDAGHLIPTEKPGALASALTGFAGEVI